MHYALVIFGVYWPPWEVWRSAGSKCSGCWSRCSNGDTPLSPTQTAPQWSPGAHTRPTWREAEKIQGQNKKCGSTTCSSHVGGGGSQRCGWTSIYSYRRGSSTGITHGPHSTMIEPILSAFSITSLHSADNSNFFPMKFSNSKATNCKRGGAEFIVTAWWWLIFMPFFRACWKSLMNHTLYVTPAPPWPFPAACWSGIPWCSGMFPLQDTAVRA